MYCNCKEKKPKTNSIMKESFKVCAKSLGGCGKEVREIYDFKVSKPNFWDVKGIPEWIVDNKTQGKSQGLKKEDIKVGVTIINEKEHFKDIFQIIKILDKKYIVDDRYRTMPIDFFLNKKQFSIKKEK